MSSQTLRVFSGEEILRTVNMRDCVKVMRDAFRQLSSGAATAPPRMVLSTSPEDDLLLVMPASNPSGAHAGVKLVTVQPNNPGRGLPLIQALMLLVDSASGKFLALLDGEVLTAWRTGGATGVATDLLARTDAREVAIFGAGVQAETQLEAVCAVRPIQKALVFGRNPQKAEAFARKMTRKLGITVNLARSPAQLQRADIICTATTSPTPVFANDHLAPGTHINGVGSYRATMREVPGETVRRARVIVDHRPACLAEAGDIIMPLQEGLISAEHIRAELGEIVAGQKTARESPEQITFFKSVGNAVQDLALAQEVYHRAVKMNLGQTVAL